MQHLWTEKYRPATIDGYVFRDDQQRRQVETWIKDKSIPNLLFSGNAGIGKTTLARILINELGIEQYDVLEINASRTNSIDDVRDKIVNFVQMIPFGDFKVVLLDECDFLSPNAQAALRGVFEEYHKTARFILTCNYPNRIIPALHSRCQGFHIEKIDLNEFTTRIVTILLEENIELSETDLDTLDTYISVSYPDLRKCINLVQQNISNSKLLAPTNGDEGVADWKFEMVELFKEGKINEGRKLLCGKIRAEEMEEVYRWLYDHIEILGDETNQDTGILIIKQGLVDHTICADSEINLAAVLIKLARLIKPKD